MGIRASAGIRAPAGIDWLVSAVGEDVALSFLESVGGQRIQVPRTAEGSRLATLYGVDVASALSAEYGGLSVKIPVRKKWRILAVCAGHHSDWTGPDPD
ncbi:hypothetical protein QMA67_09435 [Gluconobacter japonicus]|uniref:hypothetical protein n=1 Tax=Gluconobacter japonicus TaxID=376620 RepID=UPI0024ACE99C|nr:hypothetical protein [Gluconobacter japonicus]MDI6653160.1 hypothetical protein [Gluconobacter japonicus]